MLHCAVVESNVAIVSAQRIDTRAIEAEIVSTSNIRVADLRPTITTDTSNPQSAIVHVDIPAPHIVLLSGGNDIMH